MHILITNDDGIDAEGLWALFRRLSSEHEVVVAAPDVERSGVGHGITLRTPLRVRDVTAEDRRGYAVNGTPADCVRLAVNRLMPKKPDFVVSGINPGANVGVSVNYSGTVAGAREAAFLGIPAMSVSVAGFTDIRYDEVAGLTERLIHWMGGLELPRGVFMNVNVPNTALRETRGLRIGRQGTRPFDEPYEKRFDPWDVPYYWIGRAKTPFQGDEGTDLHLLSGNHIVLTPLACDTTAGSVMDDLHSAESASDWAES